MPERIEGSCSCGVRVILEENSPHPLWSDGRRYAYPEDIDRNFWNIFRCRECLEPIHETFKSYSEARRTAGVEEKA